jgi:hypothetical protein
VKCLPSVSLPGLFAARAAGKASAPVPLTTPASAAAHGSSAVRGAQRLGCVGGPGLLSVLSMAMHAQGMIPYESTFAGAGSRVRSWLFWRMALRHFRSCMTRVRELGPHEA